MNEIKNERPENQFRIYEPRLEGLKHKLEILNRRAVKLGAAPIVLNLTGEVEDEAITKLNDMGKQEIIGYRRFVWVEVIGSAPKFAGWSLAACVEHAEEGNILRKSPECTVDLHSFRDGAPRCDHCNTIRYRKDTFVVIHEDGTQKMVGRNCIKDFLGHADPAQLARLAEVFFSLREICEEAEEGFEGGYGSSTTHASVAGLLNYSTLVIRMKGFVSGKAEREAREQGRYGVDSTRSTACRWMNPSNKMKLGVDYFVPEQVDEERALQARNYVLETLGTKDAETLSDFEHNMLTLCKCEAVEHRNIGLIAFIPEYFARETEKRVQNERNALGAADSKHFGTVGARIKDAKLTYLKSTGWDSQYGYTYLHSFSAEGGERIIWKTGTEMSFDVGATFTATFTIKEHGEYNGWKQTKVLRMKIAEPVAVAA